MTYLGPADDMLQIVRWGMATVFILGALTWAWFYVGEKE